MSHGILDTSVLIANSVHPMPGELGISVVSLAQLHFGVLVTRDPAIQAQRLTRLARIERHFDALPVEESVAESYGLLAAKVVSAGRQPRGRTADLLIAATAHAHGAVLYTRNAEDLRGLEDELEIVPL